VGAVTTTPDEPEIVPGTSRPIPVEPQPEIDPLTDPHLDPQTQPMPERGEIHD